VCVVAGALIVHSAVLDDDDMLALFGFVLKLDRIRFPVLTT